jgi:hypothetical protein
MLMKYLLSAQATRKTTELITEWRKASDAIVEGQRRMNDTDARERLKGCGKLLSDIDRADDRSRIRQ